MASTSKSGPYIHWIHCNHCQEAFFKKERKFFLLACQHIVCECCKIEIKQNVNGPKVCRCTVCQKITRTSEINNTMPTSLKNLFHPEPYLDGINNFQVIKFQCEQRQLYLEWLDKQEKSIKYEKEVVLKCKELNKQTFQDLQRLKSKSKQLERAVMSTKQQKKTNVNGNRQCETASHSTSSATSSLKSRKKPSNTVVNGSGVTCFPELLSENSFYF